VTDRRRPIHLAMLVGLSTSAYAITLAGVTALQSTTDATLIAERAPAGNAVAQMSSGHDRLEESVSRAEWAYVTAARRYATLGPTMADMETALDRFGRRVTRVSGAADALPGRVQLPTISSSTRVVTRTVVHATTGASG
jgi:hypothetical protein